jgi:hypothetical protein
MTRRNVRAWGTKLPIRNVRYRSVGAAVTVLGIMAAPIMVKAGYDGKLSSGTITAGGTLGMTRDFRRRAFEPARVASPASSDVSQNGAGDACSVELHDLIKCRERVRCASARGDGCGVLARAL